MTTIRVPFNVGPTRRIGRADSPYDEMNQRLKVLIFTRFGERVMRSSYGSRAQDFVFDPLDETLTVELDSDLRDAVRTWEPDVSIEELSIETAGSTRRVALVYRLRSSFRAEPAQLGVSISAGGDVGEMFV